MPDTIIAVTVITLIFRLFRDLDFWICGNCCQTHSKISIFKIRNLEKSKCFPKCSTFRLYIYIFIYIPRAAPGRAPGPGPVPARVHVRYMYVHICMYICICICICMCIFGDLWRDLLSARSTFNESTSSEIYFQYWNWQPCGAIYFQRDLLLPNLLSSRWVYTSIYKTFTNL